MGLSSNTIIHFTKNFKSLKGILEENFKIFYCREFIVSENENLDILIPMVSFCDIPFSQIISHIDKYGSYGIGLKKKWAEEEGLNPVLYIEKKSFLADCIISDLPNFTKGGDGRVEISSLTLQQRRVFNVARYVKNYQADLHRNGKVIKDYRFADEKEWRFVPSPETDHSLFANLKKIKAENIKISKKKYNDQIDNLRLNFTPEDINYIIIKTEKERDNIIRLLEKVKGKYSHEEVKRLTSRIISVEQLKTDF
ncbi:abortive infection system antitoxin AbiGi family protein [Chryseobacterium sp.]|uniref:abortive infection system antitoxin AbiGi family protein n=1 Tax=Chryseobacterium sp. TaxID=1871047 RepID=UPI0024E23025|nr:abortive infection system antitoxin AbiGi family protein [Chryseobacterium sp.]